MACPAVAGSVMDLFAPVDADHHIVHIFIDEINAFFVKQSAVGRNRKIEMLAGRFFKLPAVCDGFFHHIKVHQRFAAEKINFDVAPATGSRHKIVHRF